MKRIACLVLCCLMVFGLALAEEEPQYEVVKTADELCGSWIAWGPHDTAPFLQLNEDGTFEIYDWDYENPGVRGELLSSGTYTLNEADGTFTFEGDELVYTAMVGTATEETSSSDAGITLPAGTMLLKLETPPVDDVEMSLCYLPLPEDAPNE